MAQVVGFWDMQNPTSRFENPMAQVVRFWPNMRQTWAIRFSNRKRHGLEFQDVANYSKQQQNDRGVGS